MESTHTDSGGDHVCFFRMFAASSRTPRTPSAPEKIAAAIASYILAKDQRYKAVKAKYGSVPPDPDIQTKSLAWLSMQGFAFL
jgi:hypothetical protein